MDDNILLLDINERARWEGVETGAMPSQCWRYADALRLSGFEPYLAIVTAGNSRLRLPFIERTFGRHLDIATVPGLSGASIVPASAAPLDAWQQFALRQHWVSGYLQLSPEDYPNVPESAGPCHQGHVFLIDPSAWNRRASPSLIIRRKVTAAERAGATIADDRARLAQRLIELYPETLAWFGATSILSADTLHAWTSDPRNLLVGVEQQGRVEGVHLVHVHGAAAEFHIAGMTERGRSLSALLYVTVIERLKEMGVTHCNLGGGGNAGDGLFVFKSWLGARPVPLQSIRQIYDARVYEHLCAAASVDAHSTWFPAYRKGYSSPSTRRAAR